MLDKFSSPNNDKVILLMCLLLILGKDTLNNIRHRVKLLDGIPRVSLDVEHAISPIYYIIFLMNVGDTML